MEDNSKDDISSDALTVIKDDISSDAVMVMRHIPNAVEASRSLLLAYNSVNALCTDIRIVGSFFLLLSFIMLKKSLEYLLWTSVSGK